jgi:ProP effector
MSFTDHQRKQHALAIAGILWLKEKHPKAFFMSKVRRRPLKIGIGAEIIVGIGDAMTPHEARSALRIYTGAVGYHQSMRAGAARIDLAGEPAGTVTPEEAEHAAKQVAAKVERMAKRREERRKAHQAEERPPCSSTGGSVSVKPKRLGLADLKMHALARRA